jgi:hypothetical protein
MIASVPRRRSWLWLQGLACGAALSIATAPAILAAVLLAPGLLVYATEKTPGKPVGESMLLLGLATSFMPIRILWENGHSLEACIDLLSDPSRIGVSWLAAGGAWLMTELTQIVGREFYEVAAKRRIAALQRERTELEEEWGSLEPKGSAAQRG